MAPRHQVVKTLCAVALLAHFVTAAAIEDSRKSSSSASSQRADADRASSASIGAAAASSAGGGSSATARQARDSLRRDYRCLNCPNTDERARFIDHPPDYRYTNDPYPYRQAAVPYANRDERNWYYPPAEFADDQRYPAYYMNSEPRPLDYAPMRYDDQRYGAGYNRYDDRYGDYGGKTSGFLPVDGRYGNNYRGNGYDNHDAQYAMRTGVDPYYREPDYDRYVYHQSAHANRDYGREYPRDFAREYPRDYVPPRSYPRDYVRDYNARDYGAIGGAMRYGNGGGTGETYVYRGDYYGDGGGYASGNRLGYDNRNFRPWDETYRGTSGFDSSGRGYYFAARLPFGVNSLPPPPSPPSRAPHDGTKPYRVPPHYYNPNAQSPISSSPSTSPSSSSAGIAGSGSSSSSAPSSSSSGSPHSGPSSDRDRTGPNSVDPHKSEAAGNSVGGGGGGVAGSNGVNSVYGGGGRYPSSDWHRDRPDQEQLSTRYGSGGGNGANIGGSTNGGRYLRPLAGSYLLERDGGDQPAPMRSERLTAAQAPEAAAASTAASSTAAAPTKHSKSVVPISATKPSATSSSPTSAAHATHGTASEVSALVADAAATPSGRSAAGSGGTLDESSVRLADDRL